MNHKNNGHFKRRQICAYMGWTIKQYPVKLYELYSKNKWTASQVAHYINIRLYKSVSITPRSIMRAIRSGEKLSKPKITA